jgi:hypothetical protein
MNIAISIASIAVFTVLGRTLRCAAHFSGSVFLLEFHALNLGFHHRGSNAITLTLAALLAGVTFILSSRKAFAGGIRYQYIILTPPGDIRLAIALGVDAFELAAGVRFLATTTT